MKTKVQRDAEDLGLEILLLSSLYTFPNIVHFLETVLENIF